jgi:hypothetical protein
VADECVQRSHAGVGLSELALRFRPSITWPYNAQTVL